MPKILENVKDNILNTARDMILVEGLNSISMRELALRCNISTGTIYNYFDSKQDLVISIAWNEWYSTLNRMDYSNNTNLDSMEKLKIIFLEIKSFLNIVHNMQYGEFFDTIGIEKLMKITKNKKDLHDVLSNKVFDALSESDIPTKDPLVCGIIIKLYCSYALSSDIGFEELKPYIEKLIH